MRHPENPSQLDDNKNVARIKYSEHPEFDGERANAISFLTQFEIFMVLNPNSYIARDPIMWTAYFLNITGGPAITAKDWMHRKSMRNSDLLPEGVFPKAYFEKSFRTILDPRSRGSN